MRDAAEREHTENIRAGLPILKMLYGFSIDEYDYIEIAIDTLKNIKHYAMVPYVTYVKTDAEGYIEYPCNLDVIDAITTVELGLKSFADREVQKKADFVDNVYYSRARLNSISNRNTVKGHLSYKLEEDRILIYDEALRGEDICIAFSGYIVDNEGYPLITRKQANAIAAVIARNIIMKKTLMGDVRKAQMLEVITRTASRLVQAAAIPESISDKDVDEILDINTSFNMKKYKRPNKYSK